MTSRRSLAGSTRQDFSSSTSRWAKLLSLTPADLGLLVVAPAVFPAFALALRRMGVQQLQRHLMTRRRAMKPLSVGSSEDEARKAAWIVNVAGRRGPWPANCLQRSMVLWWVLGRRGIAADLRIGVRRQPATGSMSSMMLFHAWIELDGAVINDTASVQDHYATFDRVIAPPAASWS